MPFIDTNSLHVIERLPGWHGRHFNSPSMTFAHYDLVRGSSTHEHFHPEEEVYEVIEGELELTIAQIVRRGLVATWLRIGVFDSRPATLPSSLLSTGPSTHPENGPQKQ